jgi:hypothetical protein
MNISLRLFMVLCAVFYIGCMPTDIPIAPYTVDSTAIIKEFSIGSTYGTQLFYSFRSQSIIHRQSISSWHIGFSCSDNSTTVILNTALLMRCFYMPSVQNFTSLTTIPSIKEEEWRIEGPHLSDDSIALAAWHTYSMPVYIVDLGIDENGKKLGIRKLQFLDHDSQSFTIRFAELSNAHDTVMTIRKNALYNFVHLSLTKQPEMVLGEPPKQEWDVLITRYNHLFYLEERMPYSVTGILLNSHNTDAVGDTTPAFEVVTRSDYSSSEKATARDAIGYNWKNFDLQENRFIINRRIHYLIRTQHGYYYAIRFVDFYDQIYKGWSNKKI